LWIVDCWWRGNERQGKARASDDCEKVFKMIGRWIDACPQWNVVLLRSKTKRAMQSVVKQLERLDQIINHGTWIFTSKTSIQKEHVSFNK
jgi:hypothetical protein